jgi:large subunit ribosomal protein L1
MRRRSKRYRKEAEKVQAGKSYAVPEAVTLLRTMASTKFDQSVEVALRLSIDPKKSEQSIRGSVSLPKGIGKSRRVIVFADGEDARVAQEMGADEVGMDDLSKKIEGGWLEFDVAIALPRTMKVISKLGKVLGPKGLMPSPKNGTVTEDVKTAVKEFKAGKIEFRNDAAGNVQAAVGRISFSDEDLRANVEAFIEHIKAMRPSTVKGIFIQGAALSATMGPGIALAVQA